MKYWQWERPGNEATENQATQSSDLSGLVVVC